MGRQVPNHVAIVLEESKVDASGIVVVESSQCPVIYKLLDSLHGPGEKEGVIDHDFQVLAVGELYKLFRLRRSTGEWLFDENMLSILKLKLCELEVRPNRSDDRDDE